MPSVLWPTSAALPEVPLSLPQHVNTLSVLFLTDPAKWVGYPPLVYSGSKALYKIEINQIMLKSLVCGCVTNLACP